MAELADPVNLGDSFTNFLAKRELQVECFIHSAGILKILPMRRVSLSLAEEVMRVNFFSAVEIIRLLLKSKVNNKNLRNIVFVSSTASMFGARGFNLYCASKGALDALMRALAVELAPTIRVNSVLPGGVQSEMTETIFGDFSVMESMSKSYPLGLGRPADISAAVLFLVSHESSWITGHQLVVDGGRTINITA